MFYVRSLSNHSDSKAAVNHFPERISQVYQTFGKFEFRQIKAGNAYKSFVKQLIHLYQLNYFSQWLKSITNRSPRMEIQKWAKEYFFGRQCSS